ncbi:IclR family transcriptional regulator [uncultured Herbaspirillum sp.]|uniref:IclR family transcriptional regulator n=1 Tax=uncultured Herbaspirillum sp. TaxID=160236 RepID=UPI002582C815|nr:IclR family transcriptional regulator [uncultured Herbaspirillum sp.]
MKHTEDKNSDGTQAIMRAVMALKLAAQQVQSGVRVTDVAQVLGVSKPTAHRILRALAQEGLLEQHGAARRYQLGALLFDLGMAAAPFFNLGQHSLSILEQLAAASGDSSFLFVRSGEDAICVQRAIGPAARQTPMLPVGSRQPLGVSAGGLALLAFLPSAEQEEVLEKIEARIEAYGQLRAPQVRRLIHQSRTDGYAWIHNHAVPGTGAVGLPIVDSGGCVVAAVTVAASWTRMDRHHISHVLPMLRRAVQQTGNLLLQQVRKPQ